MTITPHTTSFGSVGYLAFQDKALRAWAPTRMQAIALAIHRMHEHTAIYRTFNASDTTARTRKCMTCSLVVKGNN